MGPNRGARPPRHISAPFRRVINVDIDRVEGVAQLLDLQGVVAN